MDDADTLVAHNFVIYNVNENNYCLQNSFVFAKKIANCLAEN